MGAGNTRTVGRGHSLWLTPDGESSAKWRAIIDELANTHGTPAFAPHVTLLPGLIADRETLLSQCRLLANELDPFEIKFARAAHSQRYFQSLFVKIRTSPTLLHAHELAKKVLEHEPAGEFMPHLSLMYGDLSTQAKKRIIDRLELPVRSFAVTTIDLFATAGLPAEWRRVETFHLRSSEARSRG